MHTADQQNPPESEALEANGLQEQSIAESLSEDAAFAPSLADQEALKAELGEAAPGESEEAEPMLPISYREYNSSELQAAVESVFFMHHKPLTLGKIQELINPEIPEDDYRTAISNLMASYFDESRGIELVEVANGYQFRTKNEHKDIIRRIYQITPMKLTNAMLEVLAIAAYNQPLTKDTIEKIRGVDSSHLIRVLMDKKMLRIAGKSDDLGRPMLYATTKEFLELFGLRDLSALPSIRELEDMLPKSEVGGSEEEVLAREMEGIVANSKPLEFNDLELEEGLENGQENVEKHEKSEAHGGPSAEVLSPRTDSNGGETLHSAEAPNAETDGGESLDLPAETLRHFPLGPEGNA